MYLHSTPDYPFRSDGCSMWPDGDYLECCEAHDRLYWMGGSLAEKRAADEQLRLCVAAKGHRFVAWMMRFGVSFGGWIPSPRFRWGYGWKWPRCGPSHQGEA